MKPRNSAFAHARSSGALRAKTHTNQKHKAKHPRKAKHRKASK